MSTDLKSLKAGPEAKVREIPVPALKRHPNNPLLTAKDVPIPCRSVFNPGAIKVGNSYVLMANVCLPHNPIVFWVFRSDDGLKFRPDPAPVALPVMDDAHCVYDPRITFIDGRYIICYASQTVYGERVGIVRTRDFVKFESVAIASHTGNHNAVLFPEKINGLYARLDRPANGQMWLSLSPDLVFWGKSVPILEPRLGLWDEKVGAGGVPIKTPQGWLCIYHGVTGNCNGFIYQLGVCLLDLKDPSRVVARGTYPVFTPREPYEAGGYVKNVVFTANNIVEPDGTVRVYYGAADTCIGLATGRLDDLIAACFV